MKRQSAEQIERLEEAYNEMIGRLADAEGHFDRVVKERENLRTINADLLAALEAAKRGFESIVPYARDDIRIVSRACIEEIDNALAKAKGIKE